MFRKLASTVFGQQDAVPSSPVTEVVQQRFAAQLMAINADPYLHVADAQHRIISVFDDLRFDRADMDMLTGPMRAYAVAKLAPFGVEQVRGHVLEQRDLNIRMHLSRFRALGASPFDAARETTRRDQDYYILTPTQTACYFIDAYAFHDAIDQIAGLVVKHPVNLLRISDFWTLESRNKEILPAIGHLKLIQRKAVESDPLCRRRALR